MNTKERNMTFSILSAMAIVLIIAGHLDFGVFTVGDLFPYYSFHVMIFIFISGYFYKPEDETHILSYVKRKFVRLLIPYFIWNVFYGLLTMMLHQFGFAIGENISLYNLFIAPFLGGHQFMYNAPAWFVPALFLLEVCNIIGRKLLSFLHIRNETVLFIIYLCVGCASVYLAQRGSVYDYYRLPARIMFMAPAFSLGRMYKKSWEAKDTLPSIIYFPILIVIQLIIINTHAGLGFSAVWVMSFANSPLTPYLTTFTGIVFFLRLAKVLTSALKNSRFVNYLGENTYSVMMHHLFCLIGLKAVFALIAFFTPFCQDFDMSAYLSDIYYVYLPNGYTSFMWIYLLIGIFAPLGIHYLVHKLVKLIKASHLGSFMAHR